MTASDRNVRHSDRNLLKSAGRPSCLHKSKKSSRTKTVCVTPNSKRKSLTFATDQARRFSLECRRFQIGHAAVQIAKNPLAIAIAHAINPRAERSQRIVLKRGPQGILLMKAGECEHRLAGHRIAIEHAKQST